VRDCWPEGECGFIRFIAGGQKSLPAASGPHRAWQRAGVPLNHSTSELVFLYWADRGKRYERRYLQGKIAGQEDGHGVDLLSETLTMESGPGLAVATCFI